MMKLSRRIFVMLLIITVFTGCAFWDLSKEVTEFESIYLIQGEILCPTPRQKSIVVILYSDKNGKKEIVNSSILNEPGFYDFFVRPGEYYLAAFEDSNSNLSFDKGEYAGFYGKPDKIVISPQTMPADTPKAITDAHIHIAETDTFPLDFPVDIQMDDATGTESIIKIGSIDNLANEKFSKPYGVMGYWHPMSFLKKVGVGVYFLEKYDENKIPILFVHGALGTPKIWEYIIGNIDRGRYQPWLFYYPSGLPLEKLAIALNHIVIDLHDKYHFNELYVTAHSMGGLISRSFILKNVFDDGNDYIKLFISLSTPWAGHNAAKIGVDYAPTAVPSWYDMVPESPFIKSIYERKLPPEIKYYLFFSHKGEPSLFTANNDGSVTLESELDPRAQFSAARIFGYYEDHVSIVSSPEVLAQYNRLLSTSGSKGSWNIKSFGISE
jgi:hypothetical protein